MEFIYRIRDIPLITLITARHAKDEGEVGLTARKEICKKNFDDNENQLLVPFRAQERT